MPIASKNSATSFASGAPPEIGSRSLPPSRSFTFEKTSRSAIATCAARPRGTGFPCWRNSLARRPTPSDQSTRRRVMPVASANVDVTAVCTFS